MGAQSTRIALLSKGQVRELIRMMRNLFRYHAELRERNPLGDLIQYPKIPPFLSESLVVLLIQSGFVSHIKNARLGNGRESDVLAESLAGEHLTVEVKATGVSAFMMLTEKDCDANYIFWLHFDDFFVNHEKSTIEVYSFQPHKLGLKPNRIRVDQHLRQKFDRAPLDLVNFLNL